MKDSFTAIDLIDNQTCHYFQLENSLTIKRLLMFLFQKYPRERTQFQDSRKIQSIISQISINRGTRVRGRRGAARHDVEGKMSWKNKVYRARDRRYLQRRRGEEERTDEDESGGWFRSVSGCVGWFAVREMEGLGHAREHGGKVSRGDGLGSKGDRLPPSQGRGKLSPGSRGDLFRESSSFLSGIWF